MLIAHWTLAVELEEIFETVQSVGAIPVDICCQWVENGQVKHSDCDVFDVGLKKALYNLRGNIII